MPTIESVKLTNNDGSRRCKGCVRDMSLAPTNKHPQPPAAEERNRHRWLELDKRFVANNVPVHASSNGGW
jgi:hypothetical protein